MSDLLVLLPARGRRENAIRCTASFAEKTADAEMLFIHDVDDNSYDGIILPEGVRGHMMLDWLPLGAKLNAVAHEQAPDYKALFFVGDDCVFETQDWDRIMMAELEAMGGTGILYPENGRRNDIPEHWLVSTDIVRALGWFAQPTLRHYYNDNTWADIGRHAGCLKLCSSVLIPHHHYSVTSSTAYDTVYQQTERYGSEDAQAYQAWRHDKMDTDVAKVQKLLRKKRVSPDPHLKG